MRAGWPFDCAQGKPFGSAQGTPFGSAQGTPFGSAQGTPFGSAQGTPFGSAQGTPFDCAQGKPFDCAQGKPFDCAQGTRRPTMGRRAVLALVGLLLGTGPVAAQVEVVEYYATDAVGSVRVVFNASGQVVARADYQPFGELFAPVGELPPQQFTGQARDGEAGLDYFGARFYQPRHGRFTQGDPVYAGLFDPQQWNRYAYARANPLSFVDPDGRCTSSITNSNGGFACTQDVVGTAPPLPPSGVTYSPGGATVVYTGPFGGLFTGDIGNVFEEDAGLGVVGDGGGWLETIRDVADVISVVDPTPVSNVVSAGGSCRFSGRPSMRRAGPQRSVDCSRGEEGCRSRASTAARVPIPTTRSIALFSVESVPGRSWRPSRILLWSSNRAADGRSFLRRARPSCSTAVAKLSPSGELCSTLRRRLNCYVLRGRSSEGATAEPHLRVVLSSLSSGHCRGQVYGHQLRAPWVPIRWMPRRGHKVDRQARARDQPDL